MISKKYHIKKYTKRLSMLMLFVFLISSIISSSVFAAKNQYSSIESQRAVKLGIGSYSSASQITYQQFYKMLDTTVNLCDSKKLKAWKGKFKKARKSSAVMSRQEGMLVLYYAAETLGGDYCTFNVDWPTLNSKMGEACWQELKWSYPLIKGWETPTTCVQNWDNHMTAAYFYSFGRKSVYSDNTIFDFDPKSVSMRLNDPLTYEEGLLAALRLYDSGLKPQERIKTQSDIQFLKQKDAVLSRILNSKTNLTVTGKSYYVSNKGSDDNDGLSPESAWATLQKVNTTKLNPGDGVFFERGGLWRFNPREGNTAEIRNYGVLNAQSGVTYSAYGEGEKPRIYGSPENGADKNKWILVNKEKHIWMFYQDMQDCGGIMLNGKSIAYKVCAFWDGTNYYKSSDGFKKDLPQQVYDISTLDNLRFFCDIHYPTKQIAGYFSTEGKLYLRCDEGNPGQVYQSIEFLTGNSDGNQGLTQGRDSTFDNICFMYGSAGVELMGNCTITNCEISWVGGIVLDNSLSSLGDDSEGNIVRCGDGIMNLGSNNIVINNYVHDTYDNGITIEGFSAKTEESFWIRHNIIIRGNIVDHSFDAINMTDYNAYARKLSLPSFSDITIEDNYLLNSGYGWSHQAETDFGGAIATICPPNSISNVIIKNNFIYLSKHCLVELRSWSEEEMPTFIGNTYIQNDLNNLIYRLVNTENNPSGKYYIYSSCMAEKALKDVLHDNSAMIFN